MKRQYMPNTALLLRRCEEFLASRGLNTCNDHEYRWMPLRTHLREKPYPPHGGDFAGPQLPDSNLT